MADLVVGTNGYAGEVLDSIKTKLATGNEVVSQGLANLIPRVTLKTHIPRVKVDGLIGARVETPTTSLGTSTFDAKALTVGDFMLYHEFNPRDFESFWRPWQPEGPLVFRDLPSEVQMVFMGEIAKMAAPTISQIILSADTAGGSAPLNVIDGLVKTLEGDADVIDAGTPVALTAGNIQSKEAQVYGLSPIAVRRHPDYALLMGSTAAELHRDAVVAQTYKGNDFTMDAPMSYRGKRIIELVGLPDDVIISGRFSPNADSHLHVAMDWDQDSLAVGEDVLLVDRVANNSEKYFVRGDFKLGVGISFGEEMVLYKA